MTQRCLFRRAVRLATIVLALGGAPVVASAQAYGSGPLTGTLTETEPTSGVFDWGRVKLAPGLTVDELGYDSNVFNESTNPKDDWVLRATPDVSIYTSLRFAKISAYAGSKMAYFKTNESERSIGHEYRARFEMMFSRLHPFIGGGQTRKRARPNGEIDTRADQQVEEFSGGIGFDLGPHSLVYTSAVRFRTEFKAGVEDGFDLPTSLNHDRSSYSIGVQTEVTPITSLTVSGSFDRDQFISLPFRNTDSRLVSASLRIGAVAAVSGTVTVSYLDSKPLSPLIEPFRGVTSQTALSYSFLEIGRLSGTYVRGLQYSFNAAEAYYLENSYGLTYTHRLFGEVDLQARANHSDFNYEFRAGVPAHKDTLKAAGGGLGYNLRNRTRISLNYEFAQRHSPAFAKRNYDRTRIYVSWSYAF